MNIADNFADFTMENVSSIPDIVSALIIPKNSRNNTTANSVGFIDGQASSIGNTAIVVGLSLIFGLIIFLTIGGNILVCLAPVISCKLRTVTFNFLVSLAVADLLLGVSVLPFSAILALTTDWWFGVVFCNIYISCDVLFSTASILHLLVISLDRYIAITRPYAYQSNMNHFKAGVVITFVWMVSFCISFIPLHLGWNTPNGHVQNYDTPGKCTFTWNTSYNLFDGIILFFVPLFLMCAVYVRIVVIASRQARAIRKLMINPHDSNSTHHKQIDEHKAIKIIAIVMGCFVVCWVPYFTVFTFAIVCGWQISEPCYQVALWLGYTNSLVNPLIYGLLNREFRRAFKILLSCSRLTLPCGSHDHVTISRTINMAVNTNNRCNGNVMYRPTTSTHKTDRSPCHPSRKPSQIYLQLIKSSVEKNNWKNW